MEKNVIRKASLDHCIVMLKLEKGVSWNLPAEQLFVVFLALALTRHTLLLSNSHFLLSGMPPHQKIVLILLSYVSYVVLVGNRMELSRLIAHKEIVQFKIKYY